MGYCSHSTHYLLHKHTSLIRDFIQYSLWRLHVLVLSFQHFRRLQLLLGMLFSSIETWTIFFYHLMVSLYIIEWEAFTGFCICITHNNCTLNCNFWSTVAACEETVNSSLVAWIWGFEICLVQFMIVLLIVLLLVLTVAWIWDFISLVTNVPSLLWGEAGPPC